MNWANCIPNHAISCDALPDGQHVGEHTHTEAYLQHQNSLPIETTANPHSENGGQEATNELSEHRFIAGSQFATEDEAESLYFSYAKLKGFGVRKDVKRIDRNGKLKCRRWVCSREGFRPRKYMQNTNRKRAARPVTRTGCRAELRVKYEQNTGAWISTVFTAYHNHNLTPPHHVHYVRAHRKVSGVDLATASVMHRVGIRPSQIHEYMVQCSGGYSEVGYMRRDVENVVARQKRKLVKDSDSESCIAYLNGKRSTDPSLYFEYTIDEEHRLGEIFWCDGGCRADYAIFGDVIAFDATYRTNAYNKPLVVIVGINHHYKTTIFGFVLLNGETEQAYTWLLVTFLDAMEGKHPKAVLTDGDKAMRKAISKTFPQAIHRLCCWHLERNAQTNVGRTEFTADFKDCMLYTEDHEDFQNKWDAMVRKHNVETNEWVKKMYIDRKLWAEPYFKGQFLGGMRSTQRCEGFNAFLNQYLNRKLRLIEFMSQIDRLMNKQREMDGKDDFDSSYGSPVLCTHLRQYEQQAGQIYTRSVFEKVRTELNKEGLLFIKGYLADVSTRTYSLEEFRKVNKEWKVVFHHQSKLAACQCQLLQSLGIPCSHSFAVLKAEDVQAIPECMQLMRWLKTAKINNPPQNDAQSQKVYMTKLARIGSVNAACRSLQYFAGQSLEAYKEAMKGIHSLTLRLQCMSLSTNRTSVPEVEANPNPIQDPMLVLTKGAPRQPKKAQRKKRKCSRCNNPGHTVRTCTKNPSPIPSSIYGWNDCREHTSNSGLQSSDHNTSTWTNTYMDGSSEPTPSQASGFWFSNCQSMDMTTPMEHPVVGNGSGQ